MYVAMYSVERMARMIRKQLYIEPAQERVLKRRARELGVTEAELLRRSLDLVETGPLEGRPDPAAWRLEKEYIRRRRRIRVPAGERGWTRDELYEDRIERLSR